MTGVNSHRHTNRQCDYDGEQGNEEATQNERGESECVRGRIPRAAIEEGKNTKRKQRRQCFDKNKTQHQEDNTPRQYAAAPNNET